MKIQIERENKQLELEFNGTGVQLLKQLNINPDEVLLVKNDEVILNEDNLTNKDEIKVLSVISGG